MEQLHIAAEADKARQAQLLNAMSAKVINRQQQLDELVNRHNEQKESAETNKVGWHKVGDPPSLHIGIDLAHGGKDASACWITDPSKQWKQFTGTCAFDHNRIVLMISGKRHEYIVAGLHYARMEKYMVGDVHSQVLIFVINEPDQSIIRVLGHDDLNYLGDFPLWKVDGELVNRHRPQTNVDLPNTSSNIMPTPGYNCAGKVVMPEQPNPNGALAHISLNDDDNNKEPITQDLTLYVSDDKPIFDVLILPGKPTGNAN